MQKTDRRRLNAKAQIECSAYEALSILSAAINRNQSQCSTSCETAGRKEDAKRNRRPAYQNQYKIERSEDCGKQIEQRANNEERPKQSGRELRANSEKICGDHLCFIGAMLKLARTQNATLTRAQEIECSEAVQNDRKTAQEIRPFKGIIASIATPKKRARAYIRAMSGESDNDGAMIRHQTRESRVPKKGHAIAFPFPVVWQRCEKTEIGEIGGLKKGVCDICDTIKKGASEHSGLHKKGQPDISDTIKKNDPDISDTLKKGVSDISDTIKRDRKGQKGQAIKKRGAELLPKIITACRFAASHNLRKPEIVFQSKPERSESEAREYLFIGQNRTQQKRSAKGRAAERI